MRYYLLRWVVCWADLIQSLIGVVTFGLVFMPFDEAKRRIDYEFIMEKSPYES